MDSNFDKNISIDTQDYKKLYEELTEELSLKNTHINLLLNDLLPPLSDIISLSELYPYILNDENNEIQNCFDMINKTTKSIYELLFNLKEWNKLQSNQERFKIEKLHLLSAIQQNLKPFAFNIFEKELTIKLNIPDNIEIFAEKNSFNSIMRNLISNALKFSREKGIVMININFDAVNTDYVILFIKDNGVNINLDSAQTILSGGFISQEDSDFMEKGIGVGLLLCRGLVEKNGGKIWASTSKESGNIFYVQFKNATTIDNKNIN